MLKVVEETSARKIIKAMNSTYLTLILTKKGDNRFYIFETYFYVISYTKVFMKSLLQY
jgi:hypothetical protein